MNTTKRTTKAGLIKLLAANKINAEVHSNKAITFKSGRDADKFWKLDAAKGWSGYHLGWGGVEAEYGAQVSYGDFMDASSHHHY